eukprot:3065269-Amphidinium_carterae.1
MTVCRLDTLHSELALEVHPGSRQLLVSYGWASQHCQGKPAVVVSTAVTNRTRLDMALAVLQVLLVD